MYVDPGELNKKITIVRKATGESYDDEGHLIPLAQEEVIRTCWAKVTSQSGSEMIKAGIELTDAKKRFLVRWTSTEINEAMFVKYKDFYHNIVRVNSYADNKDYLEIWTDEKKAVI